MQSEWSLSFRLYPYKALLIIKRYTAKRELLFAFYMPCSFAVSTVILHYCKSATKIPHSAFRIPNYFSPRPKLCTLNFALCIKKSTIYWDIAYFLFIFIVLGHNSVRYSVRYTAADFKALPEVVLTADG